MSNFKNMKFRISSKEEDEKLQKYLFSLGYGWYPDDKNYYNGENDYNKFLFTNDDGDIEHCGGIEETFEKDRNTEYTLEELITYELKEVEKEFEQFEVFDKLIEINKIGRGKHFSNISNYEYIKLCTVTFDCGRQKGHTSYIKSRFNPETDILIVRNHDMIKVLYKNIYRNHKNKFHFLYKTDWMRGYNFSNIKNIWIDNYSILNKDEVNEFYKNLACKNFDKNLTIIGVG